MTEKLKNEVKNYNGRKALIQSAVVILITWVLTLTVIPDSPAGTAWCLVPALFLVFYVFYTKRILESLTLAVIMALIMLEGTINVIGGFSTTLGEVMVDPDMAWLIIVCGLMGGIVTLLERSGGAFAFGEWAATKAHSEKSALMWTWILGVIIFMDDYLNSLTVGSCMSGLTDKYKVPREMLAYVVSSTAAPLCVLIPISTWAAFAGKLLETNGWAPAGEGLMYFIKTIPFNFYGWAAAILVPLFAFKVLPIFGPMKGAYKRVAEGGPLAPPGSEKIDIHAGDEVVMPEKKNILNMLIPVISLIGFTIYFDVDMQMGVICTLVVMYVLYLGQNLMDAEEFFDLIIKGLSNMLLPLMLMVLAWAFAAVNDEIGFTKYVIDGVANNVPVTILPLCLFLALGFTEFITGTNWGMYIIALPIVIPIAQQTGADPVLVVASVLSAGVLGSHCCFYSDATLITSAATGCDNYRHAFTQMPFGLLAGVIAAVGFLICGFVFAP